MSALCSTCRQALPPAAGPTWAFTLPLELQSQNRPATLNKGYGRFEYGRRRLGFQLMLSSQRRSLGIPTARARRRVIITRLYRGNEMDPGNLVGGAKMLLDAMVRVGLLVDDKERWVEAHYHQRRTAANGVAIELAELFNPEEVVHVR